MPRSGPRTVRKYSEEFKLPEARLRPSNESLQLTSARSDDAITIGRRSVLLRVSLPHDHEPLAVRRHVVHRVHAADVLRAEEQGARLHRWWRIAG